MWASVKGKKFSKYTHVCMCVFSYIYIVTYRVTHIYRVLYVHSYRELYIVMGFFIYSYIYSYMCVCVYI